jgi:ABC-type transport system involved in multi-copper enzyme maturation permease subunit
MDKNNMMNRILAIAQNTFRETLRDRILWSALLVMLALIAFSLFAGSVSLGEDTRMIVDFGLTAIYLLQIFVAIFIGSMLLHKEVERKTFYLIIPKPITREEIILGKLVGLTATTIAVTALSTLALFGILLLKGMHGFYFSILLSVLLSLLESIILILLSILLSGLTSPILAAVYSIAFFLIGHSTDILTALITASQNSPVALFFLRGAYYVLPNLEKFNIRNAVVYGTLPDTRAMAAATLYALTYAIFLFLLARAMFNKKEF